MLKFSLCQPEKNAGQFLELASRLANWDDTAVSSSVLTTNRKISLLFTTQIDLMV